MYANDVQLYKGCSASDASNCIRSIYQDLSQIYLRASANSNKPEALLIWSPKNFIFNLPHI